MTRRAWKRAPRCNAPIIRALRTVHCRRIVSEPGRRCWAHPTIGDPS